MPPEANPTPTVIWSPQPGPQTALLECPVFEVFFGGARGGGKTEGSIGDWLEHQAKYGEHAIGIFVRRKLVQLAEVIARTKLLFPKIGAKYNEQQKTWTMRNGARLKFVYLERDSDAEEYQGHNYTRIYIEETTNFPSPGPINKLKATLRSANGVPCCMRLTGNPGGPGHNWVKARYIDPCPSGFKVITEEEEIELDGKVIKMSIDRVFIPSKITDNVLLLRNDPQYILRLRQAGSEQLVRAWLEGDWSIIDGAFFDEFEPSIHVLSSSWLSRIPPTALRFRSFDWGSARPFSVGWWAISDGNWGRDDRGWTPPYGAMVRYREWYGANGPNKGLKLTADVVAQGIKAHEKGELIRYGVADPAIFIRDGGPSIAETMFRFGVTWKRADNRRKPGWEILRQRLHWKDKESGQTFDPMMYFLDCCEDAIRTLPVLQHDDTNIEDLDTEGEDHAADEIRYAAASRPWVPKGELPKGIVFPKLPTEMTISEMIEARRRKRLESERRD